MVEAPIPNHHPTNNLEGIGIWSGWDWKLIRMRLNFDQFKPNSAMTHVLVLSAIVRRNEVKMGGFGKL